MFQWAQPYLMGSLRTTRKRSIDDCRWTIFQFCKSKGESNTNSWEKAFGYPGIHFFHRCQHIRFSVTLLISNLGRLEVAYSSPTGISGENTVSVCNQVKTIIHLNQSLLFLLNSACLTETTNTNFSLWFDPTRARTPRSTALEVSTLTIMPPRRLQQRLQ
jgi:hypothetical protein